MNNEFKNAPEGTTHKLDGKWYDISSYLDIGATIQISVYIAGKWENTRLYFEEYLQLQPKEKYAWYDFKEDKAFAFPTKGEKFLYEGMEACIIGVDSEGVFPVASCASVMGRYKELGTEHLKDISPIESPEVEERLEHTLKGQCKLMKKFLNKAETVKGDTLNNILEGLYDKGWRISKND